MAGEWRERPLGDLTDNFDNVRVPVKEADRRAGPYPYYGASGIVDYVDNYLFDGEYLLIAEDGENLRTRNTPVAFLARGKFWVNNHAHIVRGNKEADTRFLMYALAGREISGYLTGSTMPKLTQGNMNRIPLLAPPLCEQRAIAGILGALDDKIELNRRTNETLDAIARAVFRAWFVDFDPVRAKAEGRDPGLPKDIADLFPARLVDSELGEIPEGWGAGTLGTLGELAIGGDWGEDEAFAGAVEASCLRGVDLEHLRRDGHASTPRRWFRPTSLERRAMDDRDVLVAGSGAGPTGRPLWMCASLLRALGPCVYSNFCKRIRCSSAAKCPNLNRIGCCSMVRLIF